MKIELTGSELEDAISQYLIKMFKQPIEEVIIPDDQCVECYITLGSDKVDEDEPEIIETKVKKTRKKSEPKSEPIEEVESTTDPDEDKSTHYSKLPTLNSEEHSAYIELLRLLVSNTRNKNRHEIESIYSNASENLKTVIEANTAYQDWVKLCGKEDSESPELKLLREVNEEVDEQESEEQVTTVEPKVETTEQVNSVPHKPLFAFNNSVNKSGSLFPSSK